MNTKHLRLFLLLTLVLSMIALSGIAVAQDDAEEIEEFRTETIVPLLEEYNENLPQGYGVTSVEGFVELLAENPDIVILDVREPGELEEFGTIEGSIHIPLRELAQNLDLLPDQEATIMVVCKGGFRATIGMTALHVLGYKNALVLAGGFDAWVGEDMPVVEEAAEVEATEAPEDLAPELIEYVDTYLTNLPEGWGGVRAVAFFEESFEAMPDLLLDVRSEEEWNEGYIEGATHVWVNELMGNLDVLPEDLDANIVVYCKSGYRGGIATTMLGMLGYTNVRNLSGGTNAWIAEDLPLVTD